jgi:5-methylcytosine-specific restriction endonuclease McrA
MSLSSALEAGWAVAVCDECRTGSCGTVPNGAQFDGPWEPYRAVPCAACGFVIRSKPGGYTAHPPLQRCLACDERKPRSGFNEHNWMKLQRHGVCEVCRLEYPNLVRKWRREGLEVRTTSGRVIGRVEGCPPPEDDPYSEDNQQAWWRVVYCPQPLPGRPTPRSVVLSESCLGIEDGRAHLRTWHGSQPEDRAFQWVEDYRKRWARMYGLQPPDVEWFTPEDVTARWGGACVVCGGRFEHLDHWVPIAARGPHRLENVRPMCSTCNLSKGKGVF